MAEERPAKSKLMFARNDIIDWGVFNLGGNGVSTLNYL